MVDTDMATRQDVQGVYNLIESRRGEEQQFRETTIIQLTEVSLQVQQIADNMPTQPCKDFIDYSDKFSKHILEHSKAAEKVEKNSENNRRTVKSQAVGLGFSLIRAAILFMAGIIFIKVTGG